MKDPEVLTVNTEALPVQEKEPFLRFCMLFPQLWFHARKFAYGVELYETCRDSMRLERSTPGGSSDQAEKFQAWMSLASDGCALQLFHYEKVLEQVLAIKKHPHLKIASSYSDKNAIKLVRKSFTSEFPEQEPMRHAVAHQAEVARDEMRERQGPILASFMSANTVHATTFGGKVVRIDLTQEKADALYQIASAVRRLSDPLEEALKAVPRGQHLQPKALP